MELKRENFKKFRIVNTVFYALPVSCFDEPIADIVADIVEEVIEELILEEPTEEELAAIAKEEKKAKLQAELAELEV